MKVHIILLFLVFMNPISLFAQNFAVDIYDNAGLQYQYNIYHITQDSLTIKGKSDYGRSNVEYLKRKLTSAESKQIQKLISAFAADSLKENYFNEYSNFEYISADNFPRVIEVTITKDKQTFYTKATNAYVYLLADLFKVVNSLFPPEVNIKYDKRKFNAMY